MLDFDKSGKRIRKKWKSGYTNIDKWFKNILFFIEKKTFFSNKERYVVPSISFQTFFVQAFKIVVDS